MGLTPAHEARRKRYLGASDVPAVLGVSPFKTAADVYYSKTSVFEASNEKVPDAIRSGNLLEVSVLDYAEGLLGKIKRNQFRVHPELKWASATMDAVLVDKDEGVEAKTTSKTDDWGDEGTDLIPLTYLAQVQWQMYVTGFDRVWVPVLMPDFVLKFKLYVVERDQDIIDQIVETCTTFWEGNVLAGVCPEGCLPAQRTLKRLKRVPSKVVEVDSVLVKEYESARKVSAEAKGVEKEARVRLIQALGDGEVGTYNGGHVEYSLRTRKGVGGAPDTNYRMLKVRESHDGST